MRWYLLRTLRLALAGALVATVVAVPAVAGAAVSAPYTMVSYLSVADGHSHVYDDTDWTFSQQGQADHRSFTISGAQPATASSFSVYVAAPLGAQLTTGSYDLGAAADATHAVIGGAVGCPYAPGTLTVLEMVWSGADVVTFAADYVQGAGNDCSAGATGHIRYHASTSYRAVAADFQVAMGTQPFGGPVVPGTATVTGRGPDPAKITSVSFLPDKAGVLSLTGDTCTNVTLAYGQTCTVTVSPNAGVLGYQGGVLKITDADGLVYVTYFSATVAGRKTVAVENSTLDFGQVETGTQSVAGSATLRADGYDPVKLGQLTVGNEAGGALFTVTADGCSGRTLNPGDTCQVSGTIKPAAGAAQQVLLSYPSDADPPVVLRATVEGFTYGSYYYQLTPKRLLDTRSGLGAAKGAVGAGKSIALQVAGQGGVPATGVSAVVLNVTVTAPTKAGYLTVYPHGVSRPTASSLNFPAGWTGANSVTVKLGPDGRVDFYNFGGSTQVIADVMGYYLGFTPKVQELGKGGEYHSVTPRRLFDSRTTGTRVAAGGSVALPIDLGTAANAHVRAVAVNITAVNPVKAGFLTAWSGDGIRPGTSTLNFVPGAVVPNFAIVPVSMCTAGSCAGRPRIAVDNGSTAATDVLVDILGFYDDSTLADGLLFRPRTPVRLLDTRSRYPDPLGPVTAGESRLVIPRNNILISEYTSAVALNVTGVSPTASTFLTIYPDGTVRPTVSNLNLTVGQVVPNAAVVGFGKVTLGFDVYNARGKVDVVLDVVGGFEPVNSPDPHYA